MTDAVKAKYPEAQPKGKQYPDDWQAPLRGLCERCGYPTRGFTTKWLHRCPEHWQNMRFGK